MNALLIGMRKPLYFKSNICQKNTNQIVLCKLGRKTKRFDSCASTPKLQTLECHCVIIFPVGTLINICWGRLVMNRFLIASNRSLSDQNAKRTVSTGASLISPWKETHILSEGAGPPGPRHPLIHYTIIGRTILNGGAKFVLNSPDQICRTPKTWLVSPFRPVRLYRAPLCAPRSNADQPKMDTGETNWFHVHGE